MTLTAHEAWSRLLDRARQELPEQTFKTWLEPTEALSLDGTTIFVGAPDQFAADWNESKHSGLLAGLAPVALGHPLTVVFRVTEERKTRPQMDLFVAPPPQRAPLQGHLMRVRCRAAAGWRRCPVRFRAAQDNAPRLRSHAQVFCASCRDVRVPRVHDLPAASKSSGRQLRKSQMWQAVAA